MSIEMTGLADIVRQHASQRPDTAAIAHADRITTYAMQSSTALPTKWPTG
jgi:hypothetical protein